MTVFTEKVYATQYSKKMYVDELNKYIYETGCAAFPEPRHIIYKINEHYHNRMGTYRCPAEQTSSGQDMSHWEKYRISVFEDYKRDALRNIIPHWIRIISNCKKILVSDKYDMFEEFKRGYPHLSGYFDCKEFTWDIIGNSHHTNITTFIDCVITCILSKETENKQNDKIHKQQELRKKQEEERKKQEEDRKLLLYKKEFECAKLFDEIDKNKLNSSELYVEYKKITEIKDKGALYNTEFINYFTEDKKKYIRVLIELVTNPKPVSNEVEPTVTSEDVETIYRKGHACYFGRGVAQDYVEAARLYRLAAEQGEAFAQFNLGCMFDEGRGVEQDKVEAMRLYRLAAEQGDKQAQTKLARYDSFISYVPRPVITPPVETAASVSRVRTIPPPYNHPDSSVILDSNNDENLIIRISECNAINIVVPQPPEGLGDAPPAKKKRGRPSYKSLLLNLDKNTLRPKSVAGK